MSVRPLQLGDDRWRFGAIGTLSNITLVPLLGLFLAIAIATMADMRRTRRVLGWICAIFAVVIAGLAVLFILHYFQALTTVVPRFHSMVTTATMTALFKHLFTIIGLVLLTRAGFPGPKVIARKDRPAVTETTAAPLVPLAGAGIGRVE